MQIKGLHKNIYRLYAYSRTQECLDIYRKKYEKPVLVWDKLNKKKVETKVIQDIAGISRATYYRKKKILKNLDKGILPPSKKPKKLNKPKWGEAEKQLVLKIRRENPTYGREKIAIILKRDHATKISQSTVGRILGHLKEKGLVTKSPSALRTKRKRVFKKHAQPWCYKDYKTMELGERVQIDHMTVTKNGITFKHFQAWERKSKYICANVYTDAKASSAKRFLLEFMKQAPFTVLSIQVDGGSEFMAEFEDACKDLEVPLMVLPPSKPTYNGGVERGNRTFREEFYNRKDLLEDSVRGIQAQLTKAVEKYNTYRPHRNLKGLTPMQYINNTLSESLLLSQIA
ncbi:MAG: integrase core domain-containing protein [Alphaproteobacteria bacterium]